MKKSALVLFALFAFTFSNHTLAQDNFDKGTGVAQFTIGFPQVLGTGSFYKTRIPAMAVAYDHCIVDGLINGNASIGIGGLFGIAGSKSTYNFGNGDYGYNYTYILFGARGTFHYHWIDDLDTYAGVLIGGYAVNSEYYGPNAPFGFAGADGGGTLAGGFVGAKYYFNDNLSVLGEVGYGIAIVNVGLGYRF